jgi:hypothetical protein
VTSRASRALLSVVLLLGLCLTSWGRAYGAAAPHADQAPAPAAKVTVGIKNVDPLVPSGKADQPYVLSGSMRNNGATTLKAVTVCLHITYMATRYDMATKAPGTDEGCTVVPTGKVSSQNLEPNATGAWSLQFRMSDLFSSRASSGVYAIDAVAEQYHEQVGAARTYTVWKADDADYPQPNVAVLWPVTAATTLAGTSNGVPAVLGTGFTDQLDPSTGRLTDVVTQGKQVPSVNWVVDPDVLDSAYQLGNSYTPLGGTVTGGGAATAWLAEVKDAIKGAGCYTLPYTDPDLVSLAHTAAGPDLAGQAATLNAPPAVGGCDTRKELAWPADGAADMATIDLIAKKLPGATAVVTSGDYKAYDSNTAATVPTRAVVDGKVQAVVSDSLLTSVFAPAAGDGGLSTPGVLAGQKWLAQMAFLLRDDVTDRSTVVAAPPRDFDPSPDLVKAITASAQWVNFTTLDGLVQSPHKQNVTTRTDIKPLPATPDIKADVVRNAADGATANNALMAVAQTGQQDAAVPLRTVSTSWRGHAAATATYSATIYQQVTRQHDKVSFLPQSVPLTLSGKSGSVPVTIQNDLPTGIVVDVQACSESSYRVKVTRQPGRIAIPGNSQQTVKIPVSVVGNGQQVNLRASLYTPGSEGQVGQPYYSSDTCAPGAKVPTGVASLTVRISAIGIIALALMIGSAALLVVAIGLRVYRANRAHHASAQDTMAS